MNAEQRGDLALDLLPLVVGVRGCQIEEDRADLLKTAAGSLHRLDRVCEIRRAGIVGDRTPPDEAAIASWNAGMNSSSLISAKGGVSNGVSSLQQDRFSSHTLSFPGDASANIRSTHADPI